MKFILPDREVDHIIEWTKRNRNTYFLVKVLGGAAHVPLKLRALAAAVLKDPRIAKWKPLPASRLHPALVSNDVERAEQLLREGDADALRIAAEMGIEGADDGRRRTKAARAIVAAEYGVSADSVQRLLYPRTGREPKRPRKK